MESALHQPKGSLGLPSQTQAEIQLLLCMCDEHPQYQLPNPTFYVIAASTIGLGNEEASSVSNQHYRDANGWKGWKELSNSTMQ